MTAQPVIDSVLRATPAPLHVLVIGGGIGGLTLAQGLRKSGVRVAVYERDRTMTDRVQGYRVHVNPAGSLALRDCLPPALFDAFARTCGKPSQGIRFVTERVRVLLAFETLDSAPGVNADAVAQHRSVSRITLRQVLLSGLDDVVHFGKTFVRYEELRTGRVVAHFADGSAAEGDVLVAADGGGSRVRRQFLPHAERIDTGNVGIAGKVFLDGGNRERIAPELRNGMTLVSGQGGYSLFVALQEIDGAAVNGFGGNDGSAAAGAHFDNARSYLMWAFGARREKLGLAGRDTDQMSGDELRGIVLATMASRGWDQRFRDLVRLADAATINALTIRTALPVAPWPTRRITLLGDAIHAMTPYRGIGANVALKDAARLCRALKAANFGERALHDALHAYETEMIDYGFRAVRTSLEAMQQAMPDSRLRLALSRAFLRTINHVPPLKQRMFRAMGNE
jgi:2-polyprenyl-6-methoxyphenol hydroxylase-like FAD-dependent oxidoreductase